MQFGTHPNSSGSYLLKLVVVLVVKLFQTLCNPMNWSLAGSSVHGISQARIPGWVAISFSWESS